LTILISSKVKCECSSFHQQGFDKIKRFFEIELHLCYPDFNKSFHFCTDVSDHQLGAVIIHKKDLYPFISESLIYLKSGIQPLKDAESCYHLLKPAISIRIFCWVTPL
jgi:hypothetical protein